jgi:uncharacterized protein (DUF1015 family)
MRASESCVSCVGEPSQWPPLPWPAVPELSPFPALRYDARAIGEVSAVLCPPYDVIDRAERERLARGPHNAVHLELAQAGPAGDAYAAAAQLLGEWQTAGLLRIDDRPLVYVYEQHYRVTGRPDDAVARVSRGFFCRLRLEEPGRGVLRHERTMSAPKEDRFRLLRSTRVNLSPVLMLYRSAAAGAASARLLDVLTAQPAEIEAVALGGRQRLWAVDPAQVPAAAELLAIAAHGPLVIADGHHRYETALRFRDEVGGPGSDQILVLLHDADSGGLSVLPTHRLLLGTPETESLIAALAELFELEAVAEAGRLAQAVEARSSGWMGVWTRHGGFLLRPRRAAMELLLPAASNALRELDVTVLGTALERTLGLATAQLDEQGRLRYIKDAAAALAQVDEGRADACFLLNATPVQSVLEVASAGELMPPKSTYFVPKAATGLVFNLLSA